MQVVLILLEWQCFIFNIRSSFETWCQKAINAVQFKSLDARLKFSESYKTLKKDRMRETGYKDAEKTNVLLTYYCTAAFRVQKFLTCSV